jgi:hypothetical protein
MNEN